jgi:hypothetical protein
MRACITTFLASSLLMLAGFSFAEPAGDDKPKSDDLKGKQEQTAGRELHVVGIYEGYTKTDGKIHGGKAQVSVSRPGKLVTLVLVSNDPVTWEVTPSKDTRIEKVILGGSHKAAVKGIPDKTQVIEAFREGTKPAISFFTYSVNSPAFHPLAEAIAEMTGQKIASFTGQYRADSDKPLVVDAVQNDERLSADYPQPVPAATLPKLTFMAHHFVSGRHHFETSWSFGEYTLAGPVVNSLRPLPDRVAKIAYDPIGKKYYGIADHGLALVDMDKKTVTKIDMGLDVPKMSWPAAITFDTKRERVLVTTSTHGYLFAYCPKTQKWEVLADKLNAPALTYHPKDDALYGVRGNGDGELFQLNEKGAMINSIKLDGPILPGMLNLGPGVTGVQLAPADDKLVLLVAPVGPRPSEGYKARWSYVYMVDQKTGKAQLTWKGK